MKKSELIEKLQAIPGDPLVILEDDESVRYMASEIKVVEVSEYRNKQWSQKLGRYVYERWLCDYSNWSPHAIQDGRYRKAESPIVLIS